MPASATCTAVRRSASGGFSIDFADGTGLNFASVEDIRTYIEPVDSGPEGEEFARKALLARFIRTDPDGSDNASIVNRTATINFGALNPVQIG